jgi:hypothetical protein
MIPMKGCRPKFKAGPGRLDVAHVNVGKPSRFLGSKESSGRLTQVLVTLSMIIISFM